MLGCRKRGAFCTSSLSIPQRAAGGGRETRIPLAQPPMADVVFELCPKGKGAFSRLRCWMPMLGGGPIAPQPPAWLSKPSAASKAKHRGAPRCSGCSSPWPRWWILRVRESLPALRRLLILAGWAGKGKVPWKMPVGSRLCPPRRFGGREHLVGAGGGKELPSALGSSGGGEGWV